MHLVTVYFYTCTCKKVFMKKFVFAFSTWWSTIVQHYRDRHLYIKISKNSLPNWDGAHYIQFTEHPSSSFFSRAIMGRYAHFPLSRLKLSYFRKTLESVYSRQSHCTGSMTFKYFFFKSCYRSVKLNVYGKAVAMGRFALWNMWNCIEPCCGDFHYTFLKSHI